METAGKKTEQATEVLKKNQGNEESRKEKAKRSKKGTEGKEPRQKASKKHLLLLRLS